MAEVTRTEIASHISALFGEGWVSRVEIVSAARQSGAPDVVVGALEQLPDRSFVEMRDIWQFLPDVPVGMVSVGDA